MFFRNTSDSCDYLENKPDNFAVLLKGQSLEIMPQYIDEFNSCLIVSDYDDELELIGEYLQGKEIIHFTNRSKQSSLAKKSYKNFNINHIQTGQVFRFNHFRLMETFLHYKKMFIGLNVHSLPECLLSYHQCFGEEYGLKFPNTGILSLIYTLEMVRPKILWIFGLDFYSSKYMTEQTQTTPLTIEQQAEKLTRLGIQDFVFSLFGKFPETQIRIASYFNNWPEIDNVSLLKNLK